MKTHWKQLANLDYLGAYSLTGKEERTLTIKSVANEMVVGNNGKKEQCIVCYFTDSDKPMILNRTNCKTITKLHGTPIIEEWAGKQIVIFATTTKVAGETVECLRIRDYLPKQSQKIYCDCGCGAEITAANGMTAEEVSQYTAKKYGKKLAAKCAARVAQELKENENGN